MPNLNDVLKSRIAPLTRVLEGLEQEITKIDEKLPKVAEEDSTICLCATAPGVGLIVAATFVFVIDEAKWFRNAHAVVARARSLEVG